MEGKEAYRMGNELRELARKLLEGKEPKTRFAGFLEGKELSHVMKGGDEKWMK